MAKFIKFIRFGLTTNLFERIPQKPNNKKLASAN